jgi:hypothetical protein
MVGVAFGIGFLRWAIGATIVAWRRESQFGRLLAFWENVWEFKNN